ncbi:hypothetical protein GF314_00335 [bacterium]|nr:hypothetical protein [bacterium]
MILVQSFRPDLNLVYTRFGPELSLETARRCAVDTFRHPRYVAGMNELVDLRAVETLDPAFEFETIHEIWETQATWIRTLRGDGHVVIVAGSDLLFGMARIYASLAKQDDVHVTPCRDWNAACDLLGIDAKMDLRTHVAEA